MNIISELVIPGRAARHEEPPRWLLESPAWPAIQEDTQGGNLYLHQARGLEILGHSNNLVISTGTASGKSIIFQAPTLHHLALNPQARAIAIYPIKSLSRDQMARWRRMAATMGIEPESINRIDGDVRDHNERRLMLSRTRLALMTPDIIQAWVMRYCNPPHDQARSAQQESIRETQLAIREFIRNLDILVVDEAHTYDGTIGTNSMYVFQRLQHKRMQLNPKAPPMRIIAASATIRNPTEHLETLTGQTFQEVTEYENGAPRAELVVQHAQGRDIYENGWQDLADIIQEVIEEDPANHYIAFLDDRQLVERAAARIEQAKGLTEMEIINQAERSMSYRAGLMHRELIEKHLRDGAYRGITSTSAMEMGIDIPDLNVGLNLGIPQTNQRLRQRAGRVGRQAPGRFIIVAPEYAFQFVGENLQGHWDRAVEAVRLYRDNPYIRNTHQRCLMAEKETEQGANSLETQEMLPAISTIAQGNTYDPKFRTGRASTPHSNSIRDGTEPGARILQVLEGGQEATLTSEITRREALKEAYPMASYHHGKQSYRIERWEEPKGGDTGQETRVIARHGDHQETRPIRETGADLTLRLPELEGTGHLEYLGHEDAETWERITGCTVWKTGAWCSAEEMIYLDHGIPDVETRVKTTATVLIIREDWFRNETNRERVAAALRDIMCAQEGIHDQDVRASHRNIRTSRGEEHEEDPQAIAIWDKTGGGLGISQAIRDNLTAYTEGLLDIAQDPRERSEKSKPLDGDTALKLHEWATRYTREIEEKPDGQGYTPLISSYRGITFRSRLEAQWARYFDQRGISWEYEPRTFLNWLPDFRLELDHEEVYAEVKPVREFPANIAEKIDWSDWDGHL